MTVKNMKPQLCIEKRFDAIPTLDSARMRLFEILQNEDAGIEKVEGIISTDPAMAAKVIRLANSPFYRHAQRHLGMHESLLTIGLDMVKCIVLSMAVIDSLRCETKYARALWSHSYAVALLAVSFGRNKAEKDRLFTGALLHDLGRMVFLFIAPEVYTALLDSEGFRPGEDLEQETFSITHTEMGEMVARKWNFPDEIAEIIRYHHRPVSRDSALVYLINQVASGHEMGIPEVDPASLDVVQPFVEYSYKDLVNTVADRYKTNTVIIESLF